MGFMEVAKEFIQTTIMGRPKNPAPPPREYYVEKLSTPSRILQDFLDRFPFDSGLITATGKSKLEETQGLKIFEEMCRDPQVKAAMGVKKAVVMSTGWDIEPFSSDKKDVEIADFITYCMDKLLGPHGIGLKPVLSAFEFGRSDSEIIFEYIKTGEYKGKYCIRQLKEKNIGFISYILDEYQNIKSIRVNTIKGQPYEVNPFKVVHYAWDGRYGNPYGMPDLCAVYPYFWGKKALVKYTLVYGDKYACPIPEINEERRLSDSEKAAVDQMLADFHVSNGMRTPMGTKLTLHQSNGTGGAFYKMMIDAFDSQMTRAILCQVLATNENSKTGTHAQAKVHMGVMEKFLKTVRADISMNVIQNQLIKRLVDINYPNIEGYPVFRFNELSPEDLQTFGDALSKVCNIKDEFGNSFIDIKEKWLRSWIGVPDRDEEQLPWRDKPLVQPGQVVDSQGKTHIDPKIMPKPSTNGNGSKPKVGAK